jgi:hypothetical protein
VTFRSSSRRSRAIGRRDLQSLSADYKAQFFSTEARNPWWHKFPIDRGIAERAAEASIPPGRIRHIPEILSDSKVGDTMATKKDLPSYDKYFPFVVEALKRRGGSATIEEIEEDVAALMKLPEEILAIPHKNSSHSQFAYELAWVRTYLKKAGIAENSARGVWALTEQGEKATPEELRLIPKKIRWEKKQKDRDPELDLAAATLEIDWQERALTALNEMKADAFERLSQRVLRESGFTRVEVTGRPGDGGIDGIGVLRVNL